jgi:hypothetical protein
MKIVITEKPKVIMSNTESVHNYFAWPTVALLQNGKIMVGASGFRIGHICPFGKAVASYSSDNGKTYTLPVPVIDTPLDDRDAGICTFGKDGVIFTSFNNSAKMQREHNKENDYAQKYIDTITEKDEEKYLGSLFRISNDGGATFSEIFHSSVSSPHGPTELKDGTVLWAGNNFYDYNSGIEIHSIDVKTGACEFIGKITLENKEIVLCEPHLIELENSDLLCLIRGEDEAESDSIFTLLQSVSSDKGKTWSTPEMILDKTGGAPPHILKLKSGKLICTYGRRKLPYGIMAMISSDNGKTWEKDLRLYENFVSDDIGYPSTVELEDGSLLTIFYAKENDQSDPCVIMQIKWKIETDG